MATKPQSAADTQTPLKIPTFKEYFMEKDDTDPYSREKFDPWNFEFTKSGNGGMKLSTRAPGFDPEESSNGLEVVFLFESPHTQCKASNKATKTQRFCYSPDRKYSNRGYMCTECPFSKKLFPRPENEPISRPLKKTIFFLARRPNKGEEFKLIRYTTGLDTIAGFVSLKNAAKASMMSKFELDKPTACAGSVLIYHKLERPNTEDQSIVVGRFDAGRFEIMRQLSENEIREVLHLQTELIHYNDGNVADMNKRYEEKYLANKKTGHLDPWAGSIPAAAAVPEAGHDVPDDGDTDTEFDPDKMTGDLTAPETLPTDSGDK